jgi:hypothetical protein
VTRRRRHRTTAPIGFSRPFSAEEDRELVSMARCGLAVEFYSAALPARPLGELLERRLQLKEKGELELAPPL